MPRHLLGVDGANDTALALRTWSAELEQNLTARLGEVLAPGLVAVNESTQFQIEDRISFSERWGMSIFGGVGCLYDDLSDCGESDALYAMVGSGAIFTLKPEAGIVVRAEFAKGEADEYFAYLSLGHPF